MWDFIQVHPKYTNIIMHAASLYLARSAFYVVHCIMDVCAQDFSHAAVHCCMQKDAWVA